jgi:predicted SAM-dependent methyltransferase
MIIYKHISKKSPFLFLKLVKRLISCGIKLNIGSANINYDNTWIATDINTLNVLKESDWEKNLLLFKAKILMAEHVWEHLWEYEIKLANANCYKYLKKGGKLRLAVPDGFFPNKEYIEYVRPRGNGFGSEDHKILFNYKTMQKYLVEAGFKVNLLEYWDEFGVFHYHDWDPIDGFIMRSSKNDKRNENGVLKYTSLIVDAIKE